MRGPIAAGFLFSVGLLAAYAAPVRLRCESVENPLGIDTPAPHFSWQSDSKEWNWSQSAYQITVESSADSADVWDSGKVNSPESVGIVYGGPKLKARTRYYWRVRVWDSEGRVSQSTESAWWETGLMSQEGWSAKWIAWKNPEEDADRAGIRWIWVAGQDALSMAARTVAQFRIDVDMGEKPRNAALFLLARGAFVAKVNGQQVGAKKEWYEFDREDVTEQLVVGKNSIEVQVTVSEPNEFGPEAGAKTLKAALAGVLKIARNDGTMVRVFTDNGWQGRLAGDTTWHTATVVGELNDKRLGEILPPPLAQPAALVRRAFAVAKRVRSACLYATALGSYRMFINGKRVGQDVLTPDFTDYTKRVLYQTYDVTPLLTEGENVIGAILGDGWFGSGLTWQGRSFFFLPPPTRLLAQLEIDYTDGTHDTIVSDESWKALASPILRSEIYAGEFYDARMEQAGWNQPGFADSAWSAAVLSETRAPALRSQVSQPARVAKMITPMSVTPLPNGAYVFDMGQNMVGWATLKASGAAGTPIQMRFAEILNPDGTIYRQNLRNADATDVYVLAGKGEETFTPHFTFHGFRYVEVTGYPGVPTTQAITGEVVNSLSWEPAGRLTTASELVNRMWSIGLWGQRGNFLSIPTDCPQRDERLGWMGDAGVFWRTGSFNFDIEAFSHKFMSDVTDAQTAAGAFTNVSPDVLRPFGSEGAPGWGDAGVIIPWTVWLQYGDKSIITENWDAMQSWMEFIARANPDFLRKKGVGPNFADWLAPDEHTPKDLLATAYWALIANMMVDMAHAVAKDEDAKRYHDVVENIRKAYQLAYIKENGEVEGGTQTAYVVTLYTGMAPPAMEETMVNKLVGDIESRNWHLSTGFLGTPFLLFTLANHGRVDVAYRLLLNETYPSWGYMLSKGATTWWERWNGDTGDPAMNSYNHYAFGSVVAWVYRSVAGIDTDIDGPGYQEIIIHPRPDSRMTHAHGEYDSVYGRIVSDWQGTPTGPFSLEVTIPANTHAKVFLPAIGNAHVIEDGRPIDARREAGSYVVRIGSGSYKLEVK
ncbi:MAG: alpha-L-rhamnosidase [Acidobacteria bacterium]|nr:MAG: alpha-L-rhamnosidase [Acidobacteriota bacterium]